MKPFTFRAAASAIVLAGAASSAQAQVTVGITLPASGIAKGVVSNCAYTVTRLVEQPDPAKPGSAIKISDSVRVNIVADDGKTAAAAGAELSVQVGAGTVYSIAATAKDAVFAVGERWVAERPVTVSRAPVAGGGKLCSMIPVPNINAARDLGVTHHDLFAGGEVSNALRTGANTGAATGSLGMHSYSYRSPDAPFNFPFGFFAGKNRFTKFLTGPLSYQADLEELRASITVAGTGDTLFSASPNAAYAQAVLAPLTAPNGNLSSVQVMYSPQKRYGSSQTALRGIRFSAGATRSAWGGVIPKSVRNPAIKDSAALDSLSKNVTLLVGDVRWRWVFINHNRDDNGNTFSFAMDVGATVRGIAGDIVAKSAANDSLRLRTLGTPAKTFWGPVAGLYLTLRQVSAFAEIQKLRSGRVPGRARVENLEGWQPIIGFKFEAPIFTIKGDGK